MHIYTCVYIYGITCLHTRNEHYDSAITQLRKACYTWRPNGFLRPRVTVKVLSSAYKTLGHMFLLTHSEPHTWPSVALEPAGHILASRRVHLLFLVCTRLPQIPRWRPVSLPPGLSVNFSFSGGPLAEIATSSNTSLLSPLLSFPPEHLSPHNTLQSTYFLTLRICLPSPEAKLCEGRNSVCFVQCYTPGFLN